ncbi:MAG: baseplate J/gp47 family protein [Bacteroidia bacterium]
MKADRHITHLLYPEGLSQEQRLLPMLEPHQVPVDGRNIRDRIEAARTLASALQFVNLDNIPVGNWQPFWSSLHLDNGQLPPLDELLATLQTRKDLDPQMALFIAFLAMHALLQSDVDKLSQRHLDFFYEKVLNIHRKAAILDKVHVVFTPAKHIKSHRLPAGTLLDAGPGADGLPFRYSLDQELIVSQAQAVDFRNVWVEDDRFGRKRVWAGTADTSANFAPFGTPQLALPTESRSMNAARIGFAIASPQLLLKEGTRTITIQIAGQEVAEAVAGGSVSSRAFKAIYTGPEGWYEAADVQSQLSWPDGGNTPNLTVTINLEPGDDASMPYDEEVHLEMMATEWPVLKLELDPENYAYESLQAFKPIETTIEVAVSGVEEVIVQNDLGLVDHNEPFLPFGPQPVVGANCYFGSEEIFRKPLTNCDIHLHWADLPADLEAHYSLYHRDVNATSFQTNISIRRGRQWEEEPIVFQGYLFQNEDTGNTTFSITETKFSQLDEVASLSLEPLKRFSSKTKDGFIRMSLIGPDYGLNGSRSGFGFKAFGHQVFSPLYARQAMALSQHLALGDDATGTIPELPLQPYTPKIDSISIDYQSSISESLGKRDGKVCLFSLDAFGHIPILTEDGSLLPQYTKQAYALIGLERCELPQQLNILIHVADVPAPPEGLAGPEAYQFTQLTSAGWKQIPASQILSESTLGFRQRGIISLSLHDEGEPAPLLPQEKVWIGIESTSESARVLRWEGNDGKEGAASTQAAVASLVADDERNLDSHLTDGLAAETITNLVKKATAIKAAIQPYGSFGGRPTEPDSEYYVRVSERLRHRQRGIQTWDYERLLLDAFPALYKTACLNHYAPDNAQAPGHITMVVVPDWRNQPVANPLMPSVDAVQREKMAVYLEGLVPPSVTIHVENPRYEQILVESEIAFREGFDPGFYLAEVNREIQQYLSPWAFPGGRDIPFGGTVYKSEILALLEGLPAVDYVAALKLYHIHDGLSREAISRMRINEDFIVAIPPDPVLPDMSINESYIVGKDVDTITTTRQGAILVSHPQHRITLLQPDSLACPGTDGLGIGFMMVDVDFEIDTEF